MGMPDVRIHIDENFQSREAKLYLFTETHIGEPVVMKPTFLAAPQEPPTAILSHKALQEFFDQMWVNGYRPTDYSIHDKAVADQRDLIEKQQRFIDSLLKEIDALARPVIAKGVGRWKSI